MRPGELECMASQRAAGDDTDVPASARSLGGAGSGAEDVGAGMRCLTVVGTLLGAAGHVCAAADGREGLCCG